MLWFTSGQHLGPMTSELSYAVSKGALHQMTASVADALADRGIVANCINPGPVDTGYATGEVHAAIAKRFPSGRWGTPDDVARAVVAVAGDLLPFSTGEVINVDGGFHLRRL